MIDCFIISVICLFILKVVGYDIDRIILIKQFFPLTFYNNWFVAPYILLYLFSPFLNIIIENINYKNHRNNVLFLISFNIWQLIFQNNYIYNYFFTFISIYFIIAFLKKYKLSKLDNKKYNLQTLFISLAFLIVFILSINFIGTKIPLLENKMQYFTNVKNPLVFLISISLFNLFRNINFQNKIINSISNLSLLIYIIHDNYLIREYIRSDWYKLINDNFNYKYILIYVFVSSILTFIISIILAYIYKNTIKKFYINIITKIEKGMKNV